MDFCGTAAKSFERFCVKGIYDEFRIGRVFQRFPDFRLMISRKYFILIRDATLMDFIDG